MQGARHLQAAAEGKARDRRYGRAEVMIPLVAMVKELTILKAIVDRVAAGFRRAGRRDPSLVGT
jgi:phosphoenolpyruvate-protein kinase (PTS system EI component)